MGSVPHRINKTEEVQLLFWVTGHYVGTGMGRSTGRTRKRRPNRAFTARCYASAVQAMGLCPSVCLCLCLFLSQAGVLLKRQNVGSQEQHHTIPHGVLFSDAKDLREIRPGSPPTRAPNAGGVVKIGDFRQIAGYISKSFY